MRSTVLAALVLSCVPTFAQSSNPAARPTEVRGHLLGETFKDFLSKAGMSQKLADCRAFKQDSDLYSLACIDSGLIPIADSGSGEILSEADPDSPSFAFSGSRLVKINMTLGPWPAAFPALRQKYGQPKAVNQTAAQNVFGAKWMFWHAEWKLPDGSQISADEFSPDGGPTRETGVTFTAAGSRSTPAESPAKSPFDKP